MSSAANELGYEIRLNLQDQNFLGDRRVALLEQIDTTGSISRAAKAMGMSYKAAWDAVDAMNNLSSKPLVIRVAGGAKGGGSEVTRYGRGLIAAYRTLQKEHELALQRFQSLGNAADLKQLMEILAMKTTARNQLRGTVKSVKRGAVNGDVILDIGDGMEIFANITNESIDELGLKPGREAVAIIKASFVTLSPDREVKVSTRNRLWGAIIKTTPGAVNSEVKVELPGSRVITAVITNESLDEFDFTEGSECCALIKASHVILAVH